MRDLRRAFKAGRLRPSYRIRTSSLLVELLKNIEGRLNLLAIEAVEVGSPAVVGVLLVSSLGTEVELLASLAVLLVWAVSLLGLQVFVVLSVTSVLSSDVALVLSFV
uniref:Uncharacterized protein n=1 Tax=Cacopsylla melanoneura TaxID=428564 RepID=A0A8D9EJV4_9HEMI